VVEFGYGFDMAKAQAALGGSHRVSWVGGGFRISPIASIPMYQCCICHSSLASIKTAPIAERDVGSLGSLLILLAEWLTDHRFSGRSCSPIGFTNFATSPPQKPEDFRGFQTGG
jgi:hypothetical protein